MFGLNNNILEEIKTLKPFYKKNILKDIYSWQELEQLLNFRPVVNNQTLKFTNDKKYEWLAGGWLSNPNSYPADLLNKEIRKSVCFIQDCSRVNKKINDISKQLEDTLNCPTDAHIYFSLMEKETDLKGFGKHNDTQHNIIVCVDGEFNIKIYDENEAVINENMKSGDIVFIPAGTDHQVTPKTKRLSISFAMSPKMNYFQTREWINV